MPLSSYYFPSGGQPGTQAGASNWGGAQSRWNSPKYNWGVVKGAAASAAPPEAPPLDQPSGTGLNFLSGTSYMGRPLSDPGNLIDPTAGGKVDFPGAFLQGSFLRGEMGPGGYLSEPAQQRTLARGVNTIARGGRDQARTTMESLLGTGVNRRYAVGATRDMPLQTANQAGEYYNQGQADIEERRFDAMNAFIDSLLSHAEKGKDAKLQKYISKKAADATKKAGQTAALGAAAGAVGGGYVAGL